MHVSWLLFILEYKKYNYYYITMDGSITTCKKKPKKIKKTPNK